MATGTSTGNDAMAFPHAARRVATPVESSQDRVASSAPLERERLFYVIASLAMLVITAIGFRQFLLHGRSIGGEPMTPQIVGLIVIHGSAMLGWVLLLFVQSLLILSGRPSLHVMLGRVGAVLAAAIVILGPIVAPLSAHFNPNIYIPFGGARFFMALAVAGPIMFGVLAAIGLANRHRPEVHRPMMLLATLAIMTGAIDRAPHMPWVIGLVRGNVPLFHWGQVLLLGAILFALHAVMTRRPSRYYVMGYAGLAVMCLLATVVARSAAWDQLASLVVR